MFVTKKKGTVMITKNIFCYQLVNNICKKIYDRTSTHHKKKHLQQQWKIEISLTNFPQNLEDHTA